VPNYFKKYEQTAFVVVAVAAVGTGVLGIYCGATGWSNASKLIGTSGLLATLAGVLQLEVSGLFTKIFEEYGDVEKYPYGPPSYITREVIANPDSLALVWLKGVAFHNPATGFWCIVVGTLLQVVAVWS